MDLVDSRRTAFVQLRFIRDTGTLTEATGKKQSGKSKELPIAETALCALLFALCALPSTRSKSQRNIDTCRDPRRLRSGHPSLHRQVPEQSRRAHAGFGEICRRSRLQ